MGLVLVSTGMGTCLTVNQLQSIEVQHHLIGGEHSFVCLLVAADCLQEEKWEEEEEEEKRIKM